MDPLFSPRNPNNPLERHGDDDRRSVPRARRLDGVASKPVHWLWPGRIPLGKLTLLCGDPGLGKSYLTLDLAARVSTGRGWPDDPSTERLSEKGTGSEQRLSESQPVSENARCLSPFRIASENPPHSVMLLSAEDDAADTIRPRLDAAGADCRRIAVLDGVYHRPLCELNELPTAVTKPVSIPTHLTDLEEALDRLGGCRLLIIDPISAFLDTLDSHRNADVRRVLALLARLAADWDLAVVAVTHLTKTASLPGIYRAMGSLAFVAAARAAWVVARDRSDAARRRRLLLPLKNNLASDETGLAFSLTCREGSSTPTVEWEPSPVAMPADDALGSAASRRAARREDARTWLAARLADDPVPAATLLAESAAAGHNEKLIRRAFADLGGRTQKDGDGWTWTLGADEQ